VGGHHAGARTRVPTAVTESPSNAATCALTLESVRASERTSLGNIKDCIPLYCGLRVEWVTEASAAGATSTATVR